MTESIWLGNFNLSQVNRDAREQTVESIWEITEHLNILYRENWTRLAEQEITRFQDRLVEKIMEDMHANSQTTRTYTGDKGRKDIDSGPSTEPKPPDYEWNFAKAFLYSLTVLTTIGEYCSQTSPRFRHFFEEKETLKLNFSTDHWFFYNFPQNNLLFRTLT